MPFVLGLEHIWRHGLWAVFARFIHLGEFGDEIFLQMLLIAFGRQDIIRLFLPNLRNDFRLASIASIVTTAPASSRISRSLGMAVISLDFSSTATWPSSKRLSWAQALTTCRGFWLADRSSDARAVLPSMLISRPSSVSAKAATQLRKQSTNFCGSMARMTRPKVSWDGMPLGNSKYFFSQLHFDLPNFSMPTKS